MFQIRNKFVSVAKTIVRHKSSRRKREEVPIPEAARINEPWNEKRGTRETMFEYFEPKVSFFGPDFITMMQTPIDFSPKNVKKWVNRRTEGQEAHMQRFLPHRIEILGPDLAAAHFIVFRGGKIRFANEREWVTKDSEDNYNLPDTFMKGLFVEAIDVSGFNLRHTGLENILDLPRLKWLSFADQPLVDDWTLDAISSSYADTLQYLDISNCPRISHRALACFYRFQKLETLIVDGISSSSEFKLSCMMLEDLKPNLKIRGVDYTPTTQSDADPQG